MILLDGPQLRAVVTPAFFVMEYPLMYLSKLRHVAISLLTAVCLGGLAATAAAQDGPKTLTIDPVHTNVLFRIQHFGAGYVFGEFLGENGEITYDPDHPDKMTINLTIPVDSVSTDNAKRDKHLKSPDFFNAKQFPTITFKSTKVARRSEDAYTVTGDLTIRDKTRQITTLVQVVGSGKGPQGHARHGFYTTFNINRSDFGVDYMPDALSDNVKLILSAEAVDL